jgi:hypothetical protein
VRTILTFFLTLFILINSSCFDQQINLLKADVCIIGAGSAGIGAALAASRSGADVILIEKENKVGGTSVQSYVNNWEPGPGCSYSYEIYHRLPPGTKGVAKQVHPYDKDEPYGLFLISPQLTYNHSLRRSDLDVKTETASVVFDVNEFDNTVRQMLEAYGVPYRCLIPKGFDNLLVAGRGAGFSHIAASSCRLSRTMMSIGHAAGFAAWLCASEERAVWDVPIHRVQAEMNLKLRPKKDLNADPLPLYGLTTVSKNQ